MIISCLYKPYTWRGLCTSNNSKSIMLIEPCVWKFVHDVNIIVNFAFAFLWKHWSVSWFFNITFFLSHLGRRDQFRWSILRSGQFQHHCLACKRWTAHVWSKFLLRIHSRISVRQLTTPNYYYSRWRRSCKYLYYDR